MRVFLHFGPLGGIFWRHKGFFTGFAVVCLFSVLHWCA